MRHGESESNLAQRLALDGCGNEAWSDEFRKRHNSRARTAEEHCRDAQFWIRKLLFPSTLHTR